MPLLSINPTQWFILGFIFIGLSFLMAHRIPASLAGAALTVGFMTWPINAYLSPNTLGIIYQLILFFLILMGALYFSSAPLVEKKIRASRGPRRDVDVGFIFTLSSPIQNGHGLVILQNKQWKLVGTDQAIHSRVVVVSKERNTLYVRPVKEER